VVVVATVEVAGAVVVVATVEAAGTVVVVATVEAAGTVVVVANVPVDALSHEETSKARRIRRGTRRLIEPPYIGRGRSVPNYRSPPGRAVGTGHRAAHPPYRVPPPPRLP